MTFLTHEPKTLSSVDLEAPPPPTPFLRTNIAIYSSTALLAKYTKSGVTTLCDFSNDIICLPATCRTVR